EHRRARLRRGGDLTCAVVEAAQVRAGWEKDGGDVGQRFGVAAAVVAQVKNETVRMSQVRAQCARQCKRKLLRERVEVDDRKLACTFDVERGRTLSPSAPELHSLSVTTLVCEDGRGRRVARAV